MSSDPITDYEKDHHTLLKSWLSSVILHAGLVVLLIFTLKSPQSGLGNREGNLANFRQVGIHLKEAEAEQFEQIPVESAEETQKPEESPTENETASVPPNAFPDTADPFSKPPVELSLPAATTGTTEVSIPAGLTGSATSSSTETGIQPSGNFPSASEAPLGVGESAFLGIRSKGDKVVFLLDHSESMHGAWDDNTKIKPLDFAKFHLKQSLQKLAPQHQFQIIFYNRTYRHLTGNARAVLKLLPATSNNRTKANQFINQIRAGNSTLHLPALKAAMSVKPDVIYFLTDSESEISKGEMEIIHRMNRQTTINCIEFGKGPPLAGIGMTERNFLQRFAGLTGGEYRYVDITKLVKEKK